MNDLGLKLQSLGGLVVLIVICWALSEDRRRFPWRVLFWGLGLQVAFAFLILKTVPGHLVFLGAEVVLGRLISFSDKGAEFLFGKLVRDYSIGATFAFQVLPVIIFVSGVSAVLYYFRVIQLLVNLFAKIMRVTMRISGAEALAASLQIFMGIESSATIGAYIRNMTRSEIFVTMTAFMATIAASVMAAYMMFGAAAGHLLAASIMCAPSAVVAAKILVPERERPETLEGATLGKILEEKNVLEAVVNATGSGLNLALQVGALLLVFVGMIHLVNAGLGLVSLSLEQIFGWGFTPFALLLGVPLQDAPYVGQLLGIKTVFNEFLGYARLQSMVADGVLSPRSADIATYALCGFSNFGSMGILIAGMSAVAPGKKSVIVSLALKSLLAGTIATFMTTIIAGMFL